MLSACNASRVGLQYAKTTGSTQPPTPTGKSTKSVSNFLKLLVNGYGKTIQLFMGTSPQSYGASPAYGITQRYPLPNTGERASP